MKYLLILATILLLLISPIIEAAPSLGGIAINPEKRECGFYDGGDEFYRCESFKEWNTYYPEYYPDIQIGIVETPFGSCNLTHPKSCCEQLNLTFQEDVSTCHITGIGLSRLIINLLPLIAIAVAGIILILVLRYFKKKRSRI